MSDKIRGILLNSILGDALCTAIDGLSKGKILSDYKEINNYIEPLLNRKTIDKWRKGGLYSSISQFMIISSFSLTKPRKYTDMFMEMIERSISTYSDKYSIFRHTGTAEREFIKTMQKRSQAVRYFDRPCTRVVPIVFPLSFSEESADSYFRKTADIMGRFTSDEFTISGAMILLEFLAGSIKTSAASNNLINRAIDAAESVSRYIKKNTHIVFDHQLNPDKLLAHSKSYYDIFCELNNEDQKDKAELKIIDNLNRYLKDPVKRATVNHPLAIIPYAFYIVRHLRKNPKDILFNIAYEGGSSAPLASVAGAVTGSLYGTSFTPEVLIENLVNKKKVLSIIGSITEKRISSKIMEGFIKSEIALTQKEHEEFHARSKLKKETPKKNSRKKEKEALLTKHVVESWTKLDKAKWKKLKKNIDLYNKK